MAFNFNEMDPWEIPPPLQHLRLLLAHFIKETQLNMMHFYFYQNLLQILQAKFFFKLSKCEIKSLIT